MGWRGKVIVRRGMIEWRGVFRWLCVSECAGKGVEWKSQNDLVRL